MTGGTRACHLPTVVLAAVVVARLAIAVTVQLILRQEYRLVFADSEAVVAQTRTVVAFGGIGMD